MINIVSDIDCNADRNFTPNSVCSAMTKCKFIACILRGIKPPIP